MPHRMMNLSQVAAYLHLPEHEIERLVKREGLPHQKTGGRLTFRNIDVDAWMSRRLIERDHGNKTFAADFHKRASDTRHGGTLAHAIIPELLTPDRIDIALGAKTRSSVISEMTMLANETGLVNNQVDLLESLRDREDLCSTAMPGGIALLHPRHHLEFLFEESFIALGRATQPVPFGAPDGKMTDLFFLICSGDDKLHLHTLARIAAMCSATNLIADLRVAETAADMFSLIVTAEEQVIIGMNR